jgi:thymidine phosphorylase
VTLALCAELLVLGGLQPDLPAARAAAEQALSSGAAAEVFAAMASALGGPADLLEDPGKHLPRAPIVRAVEPLRAGVVSAMDVRAVGVAIVELGGGRTRETDPVDHAVGLTEVAMLGESVGPGGDSRPLAVLHARDESAFERAAAALRAAVTVGDSAPTDRPVLEVIR